jgi:hypothetical protein
MKKSYKKRVVRGKKNVFQKVSQATTFCVQKTLTKEQIFDLYCHGIDK